MRFLRSRAIFARAAAISDNAATPVALTAIVYGVFIAVKLYAYDFDASAFVTAGDRLCDRQRAPTSLRLSSGSWGYDGQYYYRLALNPTTSGEREFGIWLDNPVYRHQRILYPLLVWLLSGGSPGLACWMMLAVNYTGLCVLACFSARYVGQIGRHALWGLVFPLYPGLLLTLARDLTEICSAALIVAALAAARRGEWRAVSAWLTLAAFARETTVVLTVGLLLAAISSSWPRRLVPVKGARWLLVPLVLFAIWQLALRWWWKSAVPLPGVNFFAPPLLGFLSAIVKSVTAPRSPLTYAELVFIAAVCGAGVISLRQTAAPRHERLPFILYVALVAMLGPRMWGDDWGFLRIVYEAVFMAFIVLLQSPPKPLYLTTAYSLILWGYLFATRWQ